MTDANQSGSGPELSPPLQLTTIRAAGASDAALITEHRARMFLEAGFDPEAVRAMTGPCKAWLQQAMPTQGYAGFIAERQGRPVGGIGMLIHHWAPHPHHPANARRGYILNLYVDADYRGDGLGGDLLARAEGWLQRAGVVFATLHPTERAASLYRRFDWEMTGEMAKRLQSGFSPDRGEAG